MSLPIHLFQFWYPRAFEFFMRLWRNSLLLIEEDLAVGLMWKLLITPLFHDASFIGRIISFFFRLSRILIGLAAFMTVSLTIGLIAILWFLTPLLLIVPLPAILGNQLELTTVLALYYGIETSAIIVCAIGVIIYGYQIINRPLKKIWQIKKIETDFWQSTKLEASQINREYLFKTKEAVELFQTLEISETLMPKLDFTLSQSYLTRIYELAKQTKATAITSDICIVASWQKNPHFLQELLTVSLKDNDLIDALQFLNLKRNQYRKIYLWDDDFAVRHLKGINRGWMSAPTPVLDMVSTDLTKLASTNNLEDFVGRASVLHEAITVLSQSEDRNLLLVGPPGVGKSTLVHHLAKLIISGDAPPALATKRIVQLDLSRLTAGITVQGELAQRVAQIFSEISYCEDIILFIDEIHNLGIGDIGSNFNLYALITPFLESGKFQFIGSTEENNFAEIIRKNGSFSRLFHKILIPPASMSETLETVEIRAIELWRKKGIVSTFRGLKELVFYAEKLVHDRVLPDSAITILKECEPQALASKMINRELIKKVLESRVSVPLVEIDSTQKQLLLNLEVEIHKKMIDQEEAVKIVADTLRRASTSLREQNRPIGSFLFVGPTGVGKTELAKALAELYFKDKGAFLRYDMSEYQTEESVNRLIGTETHPGELTETVKNRPYGLLLLDEFEKADPKLLNLFLQVLDDGRLTDYEGNHVDFTNTIIIATSNAASLQIAEGIEQGLPFYQLEKIVKDELLKVYHPELLNRFDRVVIFKPLSEIDLAKIVHFKLVDLSKILEDQGYLVEFDDDIIREIGKKGYDPVLGARPMKRVIQDILEAKLSRMILNNELKKGELYHLTAKELDHTL